MNKIGRGVFLNFNNDVNNDSRVKNKTVESDKKELSKIFHSKTKVSENEISREPIIKGKINRETKEKNIETNKKTKIVTDQSLKLKQKNNVEIFNELSLTSDELNNSYVSTTKITKFIESVVDNAKYQTIKKFLKDDVKCKDSLESIIFYSSKLGANNDVKSFCGNLKKNIDSIQKLTPKKFIRIQMDKSLKFQKQFFLSEIEDCFLNKEEITRKVSDIDKKSEELLNKIKTQIKRVDLIKTFSNNTEELKKIKETNRC